VINELKTAHQHFKCLYMNLAVTKFGKPEGIKNDTCSKCPVTLKMATLLFHPLYCDDLTIPFLGIFATCRVPTAINLSICLSSSMHIAHTQDLLNESSQIGKCTRNCCESSILVKLNIMTLHTQTNVHLCAHLPHTQA
jgi:hypothetical protein